MNYLYINLPDLIKEEINAIVVQLVFDLEKKRTVFLGDKIDGVFIELTETKFGVPIDSEIGPFWVTKLKEKGIRAIYGIRQKKGRGNK